MDPVANLSDGKGNPLNNNTQNVPGGSLDQTPSQAQPPIGGLNEKPVDASADVNMTQPQVPQEPQDLRTTGESGVGGDSLSGSSQVTEAVQQDQTTIPSHSTPDISGQVQAPASTEQSSPGDVSPVPEGRADETPTVEQKSVAGGSDVSGIPEAEATASQQGPTVPPVSESVVPQVAVPGTESPSSSVSDQPVVAPVFAPVVAGQAAVGRQDELGKTHQPVIVLPDRLEMGQIVDVKVKVGMIPHVMEEAHHIQSIELFANDRSLGKVDLNPKDNSMAEADFRVPLQARMLLKAVVQCNMHGKWESIRKL